MNLTRMSHRSTLLRSGLALGLLFGAACTPGHARMEPAAPPADRADALPAADIRRQWRDALAYSLRAADEQRWPAVLEATGWAWPEFADYRYYLRGRALEAAGDVTAAATHYEQIVRDIPLSVFADDAEERLLHARLVGGRAAEVAAEAERWADQTDSASERNRRRMILGSLFESAGRVTEAASLYRDMMLLFPASSSALAAEERLRALAAAGIATAPFTPAEQRMRADRYFGVRAWDAAAGMYAELLRTTKDPATRQHLHVQRGIARFNRRAYADAEDIFAAARTPAGTENAWRAQYYFAYTQSRLGRPERSLAEYRKLVELARKTPAAAAWGAQAQFKVALIHLQEENDASAEKEFQVFLDRFGNHELRQDALWGLAWARYHQGRFAEARKAFEQRARFADESGAAARYWMARCDERLGAVEVARAAYQAIAREMPLHYYGFLAAARLPDEPLFKPERARFFAADASYAANAEVRFHLERGDVLAALGRPDEAETEFMAGYQLDSGQAHAHAIAQALISIGRYTAAQRLAWNNFGAELQRNDVFYTDVWELAYPEAFADLVRARAVEHGIDPHVVLSLMREESRFQPDVSSPADAYGLLQLIVPTARRVAARLKLPAPGPRDLYQPELNIALGTAYIHSLVRNYNDNLFLAFAGYNGGPHNVDRWMRERPGLELDEFVEQIPYLETRRYVKKVTTSLIRYRYLYAPEVQLPTGFLTAQFQPAGVD